MTPIFLLATLCLGVVSAAPTRDPSLDAVWEEWKTKHGKTYNTVSTMDMSRATQRQWPLLWQICRVYIAEAVPPRHDLMACFMSTDGKPPVATGPGLWLAEMDRRPWFLLAVAAGALRELRLGLKQKDHTLHFFQSGEGQKRAVWENNMKMIGLHNEGYLKGRHGFSLEMNAFGDLTNIEFRELMTGFQSLGPKETTIFQEPLLGDVPKSVDWREHGYVTPVKDQGQCGACWAFSAIGSLEGQIFRKTGKLVSLSEQNLVDCSWSYGNLGCDGGLMELAFQYVKENRGLDTRGSYAYEAKDGPCRYDPKYSAANITGFVKVSLSEDALMNAVATVGPISVGIDTHHHSFRFYRGGEYGFFQ